LYILYDYIRTILDYFLKKYESVDLWWNIFCTVGTEFLGTVWSNANPIFHYAASPYGELMTSVTADECWKYLTHNSHWMGKTAEQYLRS